TILAKNVYGVLARTDHERTISRLARALVPIIAIVAALVSLLGGMALVPLLLIGYNLVTQLFPALILCLPERPLATSAGALAGIASGGAIVIYLQAPGTTLAKLFPAWPAAITDLNIGLVALIANTFVVLAVSALTRARGRA